MLAKKVSLRKKKKKTKSNCFAYMCPKFTINENDR